MRPSIARRTRSASTLVVILTLTLTLSLAVALGLAPAAVAEPGEDEPPRLDMALIEEALEVLGERYVDADALTEENLTVGALRGILEALGDDGHTEYLTEEEWEIEQDALDGRVVGVGIILDERSGRPVIVSVVDGSPAQRAGLQAGDLITTVDGIDVSRRSFGAIADLVRGKARTKVRIGVERPGQRERIVVGLTREDVEVDPASWAFVPGSQVAVVRIVQFSLASGHETREAVADAVEAGAEGLVLDLRGNPGGLVDEALNAASAFLDGGVGFLQHGRDEEPTEVRVGSGRALAADLPMTVLVDYGTASSGEILAAALRDNGRARIVGEPTFGTGTVLNTVELWDGSALRIAVRRWLTPGGEDVFGVGLRPDEVVELPAGVVRLEPGDLPGLTAREFRSSEDQPLRRAVELVEDRLDR